MVSYMRCCPCCFFFQAEDGIRDLTVTGVQTCALPIFDVGALGEPKLKPHITRREVAAAAGADFDALVARRDRGETVAAMSKGAPMVLSRLVAERKIDGVISLGGGGGTAIATAAMRALPIGFPKVMVSTLASGNTAQYVGVNGNMMFPSIDDLAGLS